MGSPDAMMLDGGLRKINGSEGTELPSSAACAWKFLPTHTIFVGREVISRGRLPSILHRVGVQPGADHSTDPSDREKRGDYSPPKPDIGMAGGPASGRVIPRETSQDKNPEARQYA
jgi:hypothetical protein